jgi:hypothetical protein
MNGTLLKRIEIVAQSDGSTEVRIPPLMLWECMECIGENRVEAVVTFAPPNFIIRFPRSAPNRVNELLKDWITSSHLIAAESS